MESQVDTSNKNVIIIDHGGYNIKAGFLYNNKPSIVFPSVSGSKRKTVGKPLMSMMPGMKPAATEVQAYGNEAIAHANLMRIDSTIEDRIHLKDSSYGLYLKVFIDLGVYDDQNKKFNADYKIALIVSSFVDKFFLEQIYQIFFNQFEIKEICILPNPIACINFFDLDSGLVIDIGDTTTDCVSVLSNVVMKSSSERTILGGKDITNFLKEFYDIHEYFKYDSIQKINSFKENNIQVSLNFQADSASNIQKIPYEVEETTYEFSVELISAGEILFKPEIAKKNLDSIPQLLSKCLLKNSQIKNILITGGCAKIPNIKIRLIQELKDITQDCTFLNYEEDPSEIAWIGAKNILSRGQIKDLWISQVKEPDKFNYEKFYLNLKD